MTIELVKNYGAMSAIIARNGEPTPFLPASYLWRHPDFRLISTADKVLMT